jgi:uncharacterized protein (DUF2236 family)
MHAEPRGAPELRPSVEARLSHARLGAESVVWKVNAEVVVLLGWARAILLQLAHPLVAAAIADHSTFRSHPGGRLARLQQTVRAMLALTFGTDEEVAAAARAINAIHDRVHGRRDGRAGPFAMESYSAHDPELLRWVHATLLDSLPLVYELYVGPLTSEEKDRYCAEATGMEALLGIPEGYLPASQAALRAYMASMLSSGAIFVTDEARALAHDVLVAPSSPALWPLLTVARLPTIGLLPPALREAYGFPWNRRHERALRVSAAAIRAVVFRTPPLLRHWSLARAAYRRVSRE